MTGLGFAPSIDCADVAVWLRYRIAYDCSALSRQGREEFRAINGRTGGWPYVLAWAQAHLIAGWCPTCNAAVSYAKTGGR